MPRLPFIRLVSLTMAAMLLLGCASKSDGGVAAAGGGGSAGASGTAGEAGEAAAGQGAGGGEPNPQFSFRLALGADFGCVIDDAGAIACWGMPNADVGQAVPPAGQFSSIATSEDAACAI